MFSVTSFLPSWFLSSSILLYYRFLDKIVVIVDLRIENELKNMTLVIDNDYL